MIGAVGAKQPLVQRTSSQTARDYVTSFFERMRRNGPRNAPEALPETTIFLRKPGRGLLWAGLIVAALTFGGNLNFDRTVSFSIGTTARAQDQDNPFGFVKGKTRVEDVGRLLGAKGVDVKEWVIATHEESNQSVLLVANNVKALYWFDKDGVYKGFLIDLRGADWLNLSKAEKWTVAISHSTRTFITAENFLARRPDGVWGPAFFMLDADLEKHEVITEAMPLYLADEGGFKSPQLVRKGNLILLHANKDDGSPWANVHAFDGATGKWLGARKADPEFLKSVGFIAAR